MRVLRALEIIELTKRPFSVLVQGHGFRDNRFGLSKFVCKSTGRSFIIESMRGVSSWLKEDWSEETEDLLSQGILS